MTETTGKVHCPGECGEEVPAVVTAYGMRAVCSIEGKRWTRLRRPDSWEAWVEETYSNMAENGRG